MLLPKSFAGMLGALAVVIILSSGAFGQASLQTVGSGLSNPLFATSPTGDSNRLFLLEQGSNSTAQIKIFDKNTGSVVGTPYQTITGLRTGGERGLLGLAFDPNFASNGYYYVYVSVAGGSQNHLSEIRRYQATGDPLTSNTGGSGSGDLVMTFSQPFGNHNGGWIAFNPKINPTDEQYLYIASGDGGSGGDPQNNAQDITNNLLGKMLRIDPSGDDFPADPNRNYAIPVSNPFTGQTGDDEIWAYGLRNPWRNSFDRETGDLYIADVGQGVREEVNFQSAASAGGENYAWKVEEGTRCFDNSQTGGNPPCNDPSFTDPIYEYNHGFGPLQGNSVTGGYVYRGSVDQFEGLYFFGDFEVNNLWTIDPLAKDVAATIINRNSELGTAVLAGPSSFGEDGGGELYLTSYGNGRLLRLETTAKEAVWHGNDPASGLAGDGLLWTNPRNWERDGVADDAQVDGDTVVFINASSTSLIGLVNDQEVGAARFEADFTLNNQTLWVRSGNIAVDPGVTATINSNLRAETLAASLRKHGDGTLIANGSTNQVVVFAGTLGGTGPFDHITVRDGGNVAPGNSIGQMLVSNTATFEAGSTLTMELAGPGTAGTDFDLLDVRGSAALDGTLDLQIVTPYAPALGDTMAIITSPAISGTFDNITNIVQAGNLGLAVRYNATAVDVRVSIRGDTDFDDDVDTVDLTTAISGFNGAGGTGNTWINGDTDGDGDTDTVDLTTAISNFTGAQADTGEPEADQIIPNGFSYCSDKPCFIYDPSNGHVVIDTQGNDMISFSFQGGPFNTGNTDFNDLPPGLMDNITNQIGWTSFNIGAGLVGIADLGAILPAGMSELQLVAAFSGGANYGLSVVTGGGGQFCYCPEPTSLVLVGIAASGLLLRRRVRIVSS